MRQKQIHYSEFIGALRHCFLAALGEFNVDEYMDHEMGFMNVPLFIIMSFIMCVFLLNILIAIMSDTFVSNNNTAEAKKKIS